MHGALLILDNLPKEERIIDMEHPPFLWQQTHIKYNKFGRPVLLEEKAFFGSHHKFYISKYEQFGYDVVGNLTKRESRGNDENETRKTFYFYENDRLVRYLTNIFNASNVTWESCDISYDDLGRKERSVKKDLFGAVIQTIEFQYMPDGSVHKHYKETDALIELRYSDDGKLISKSDGTRRTEYVRDEEGRIMQKKYYSGDVLTKTISYEYLGTKCRHVVEKTVKFN
jgi:YD repeat-containing protein